MAMRAARSARIIAWAFAEIGGKRFGDHREESPADGLQAGSSADRGRTPSCLGMTPVDPGQKVAELGRSRSSPRHRRARPQEPAPFQLLREQAGALAVMPDHLQEVAAAAAKAEQVTAQGIVPQHLLDLQRQAREPLCAYPCARSPATPARPSGPGSSCPQGVQHAT